MDKLLKNFPRMARHAPRFFDREPIHFPFFRPVTPTEEEQKTKELQETEVKNKAEEAQTRTQQSNQQAQQLRNRLQHSPSREVDAEHQTLQQQQGQKTLKEAARQGVQDAWRDEFGERNLLQARSSPSESASSRSFLQNVRNLTGEANSQNLFSQNLTQHVGELLRPQENPQQNQSFSLRDLMPGTLHSEGLQTPMQNSGTERFLFSQTRPFEARQPFAQIIPEPLPQAWHSNSFQQMMQQLTRSLPPAHPIFSQSSAEVAVVFHGSLLFVRDGDKTRSFRLLEDGTLWEIHGEQGGGSGGPLSSQARAEIIRVLRQRGLHNKLTGGESNETQLLDKLAARLIGKEAKGHKIDAGRLFKDDSNFTHLLRKVLEEGGEWEHVLGEGESPEFLPKEDWVGFFSRMMNLGNAERPAKKKFDHILEFIFRGLFQKQGTADETLVSDIKYEIAGKLKEEKFAQIELSNDDVLDFLDRLKPGQSFDKSLLENHFGEDLNYKQMAHLLEKTNPALASEILKDVQFDPSANVDLYSQARLEHGIFSKSKRENEEGKNAFVPGYELQQKMKRNFLGKVKLYTAISYGVGILLFLFFIFFLFSHL